MRNPALVTNRFRKPLIKLHIRLGGDAPAGVVDPNPVTSQPIGAEQHISHREVQRADYEERVGMKDLNARSFRLSPPLTCHGLKKPVAPCSAPLSPRADTKRFQGLCAAMRLRRGGR